MTAYELCGIMFYVFSMAGLFHVIIKLRRASQAHARAGELLLQLAQKLADEVTRKKPINTSAIPLGAVQQNAPLPRFDAFSGWSWKFPVDEGESAKEKRLVPAEPHTVATPILLQEIRDRLASINHEQWTHTKAIDAQTEYLKRVFGRGRRE